MTSSPNIRKRGISVLALQEVTDELIARLTEAGLNELLPIIIRREGH